MRTAGRDLVVEDFELGEQDRGLQRIESSVDAEPRMVIAPVLPVHADLAHHLGERVVVGEQRAAVAVAPSGFDGKNDVEPISDSAQERRRDTGRAETLRGVFDDRQTVPRATALMPSKSAHWPYSDTGMIALVRGVIAASIRRGIDVVRARIDVDEDRLRAGERDHLARRDEGERRR